MRRFRRNRSKSSNKSKKERLVKKLTEYGNFLENRYEPEMFAEYKKRPAKERVEILVRNFKEAPKALQLKDMKAMKDFNALMKLLSPKEKAELMKDPEIAEEMQVTKEMCKQLKLNCFPEKKSKKHWIQQSGISKHKGVLRKKAKEMGLIKGNEKLSQADLDKLIALGGVWQKRAQEVKNIENSKK